MLFWADYYLRWWRLPIEERACRKTYLGGGYYSLRNSGLPPCTTVCSKNINKQNVNISDETLTDNSFLTRYHYSKS